MSKIGFLAILIIFSLNPFVYTQTDSIFILPKLKIDQRQNNKTLTYYFEEYSLNKFIINDSFLTANTNIYDYRVKIDDIKRISFYKGRDFWGGATVGSITGFGLGFLLWGFFSLDPHPKFNVGHGLLGGLMTAVPFGLIGGLVGLLSPTYDYYAMNKVPAKDRAEYLRRVLKKNSVKFK